LRPSLKRLPAHFYRSSSGREPVREWLKKLEIADRRIVGEDIKDVEFAWPMGMPLVRALGHGLWEVRSSLTGGRISRVIFTVEHGMMVLLHGFIKKSQKTPAADLELALRRKRGGA
jgi:phage-related protein